MKVCAVRVVNWEVYQHYKDRNPPWIKLHNSLLEDPVVAALPDSAKAHMFGIWLLASRLENKIPGDAAFIARRINATAKVDLSLLLRAGFVEWACECLQHASNPLATCTTETEERQSRGETEQTPAASASAPAMAVGWNQEAADDFRSAYRADPPKQFFAAVKPVAKRYGWSRTRPVLQAYLRETPIELLNVAKVLPVRIEGGKSLSDPRSLKFTAGSVTAPTFSPEEAKAARERAIAAREAYQAAKGGKG